MQSVKLQQFEGPLDLLLSLIEEQKLDITQIALAQVTEQFLQYIKQLKELDPTTLADFLAIAARLLVIKSRAILPTLETESEEDETGQDLAARLLLYRQFREAARYLKRLDNRRKQSFTRALQFEQRINFYPDSETTAKEIHDAILTVLAELKKLDSLPKAKIREAISIQEKIDQLQLHLSQQIETKLSTLLESAKNKSEVIITFLALLELIKQKILTVDQETLFTDITIRKFEPAAQAASETNTND